MMKIAILLLATMLAAFCSVRFADAWQPDASPPADAKPVAGAPVWHTEYGEAYRLADSQRRMLLINFVAANQRGAQQDLERLLARPADWQSQWGRFVLAKLPADGEIRVKGQPLQLLRHRAFAEMHGRPGIAVIDLAHPGTEYYGDVVSAFPFMSGKYYRWRAEYLPVILDLPPGTITQRTMVWAVRTHPERPASTSGQQSTVLSEAARSHSAYQARIGVQGHHRWERRFHRLRARLDGGTPVEVVAESWPGQNMIDSCIDCVRSWRHSSGHWHAVSRRQRRFGYDIRLGRNGIWYGTGIFTR